MKITVIHSVSEESKKLCEILETNGYNATTKPVESDLFLLDSLEMLQNLHKKFAAPIIMLGSGGEEAIVSALDSGACDYFTPPFGSAEHFARIRAAFRNAAMHDAGMAEFSLGGLHINFPARRVMADGKPVHLTPIEFRIVALLAKNQGKVLSHEQIISGIWGPLNSDNLVLRVNMANIRKKIEENPGEPRYLLTAMGVGYYMPQE